MIKSFRGKMEVGNQEQIRLSTIRGEIGYKVVKLQLINENPATVDVEGTIKIFTVKQPDLGDGVFGTATIDFSDSTLLAAGFYESSGSVAYQAKEVIIFDSVKFNQDIFITYSGTAATVMNYYLELEQVKLDLSEATVATLKDMRGA